LRQEAAHHFIRRALTISCMNGTAWAAGPDWIWVVFPSETPNSTSRNKNLASHASSRKTSGGNEVIDGTNAQTECFGGVTPAHLSPEDMGDMFERYQKERGR
jgi:hypothetical protein